MAVTHADLEPSPKTTDLGSKTGALLMVLSIILGLFCFILCLISEATRSEVKWAAMSNEGKGIRSQCSYSGNGKLPLLTATGAFLALAMAMLVHHTYLMVAISKSDALLEFSWDPDSNFSRAFAWQAGFFFITTWVSFAVGEILLLIGISVESGHLKNWATPRASCLTLPQGLLTSAGVFGLVTAFLGAGLYITALRVENYCWERDRVRREMLEAAAMYASPPRSPPAIRTAPNEEPLPRQDHNMTTLYHYLTAFDKPSRLV